MAHNLPKGNPVVPKTGAQILLLAQDVRRVVANILIPLMDRELDNNGKPKSGKQWKDVLDIVRTAYQKSKTDSNPEEESAKSDPRWYDKYWLAFLMFSQYGKSVYDINLTLFADSASEEDSHAISRLTMRNAARASTASENTDPQKAVSINVSLEIMSMNGTISSMYKKLKNAVRRNDRAEEARIEEELEELHKELQKLEDQRKKLRAS